MDKIEYRVVRSTDKSLGGNTWYTIQEVYYGDDGEPYAHTMDLGVAGESIPELRKQLQTMLWCLDKEAVDEVHPETEKLSEDGHGNPVYIYESPDGGETIYRREAGTRTRDNLKTMTDRKTL